MFQGGSYFRHKVVQKGGSERGSQGGSKVVHYGGSKVVQPFFREIKPLNYPADFGRNIRRSG